MPYGKVASKSLICDIFYSVYSRAHINPIILLIYAFSFKPINTERLGLYLMTLLYVVFDMLCFAGNLYVIYGLILRKFEFVVRKKQDRDNMNVVHPARESIRQNPNDEVPNLNIQRRLNQFSDRGQDHVLESQEVMLEREYRTFDNPSRDRENPDNQDSEIQHLPQIFRGNDNVRELEQRFEIEDTSELEDLPVPHQPRPTNSERAHSNAPHHSRNDTKDAYEVIDNEI